MKTVLYFYESAFAMWRRRLAGVYAVARQEGWHVSSVDVGELRCGIRSVLNYWKPAGVIVDGGVFKHRCCPPDAFVGQAAVYFMNTPVVDEPCFAIRHESSGLVREAMRELFLRDILECGYVHYRNRTDWSAEREAFFLREMADRGKQGRVFVSWQHPRSEDSEGFGRRLEAFLAGLPKPCGIFAANDEMAVHVLRATERLGYAVPNEVSVVGVDNDELTCENTVPTLSSVSPDFEHSGKLAANLLARRLRQPELAPVVLDFSSTQLVRRQSTRRTERVDMRAVRAVEYVRLNACKGISAADVVREMGLKTRTAEMRFREVAKRSIRDEIVAVRVAHAKDLLRTTDVGVNEIYHRCGYGDPRSLRAAFSKETGCTLSCWRARHGRS